MTPEQQWAYTAPSLQAEILKHERREATDHGAIRSVVALVDLVLEFPQSARSEGVPTLAHRWGDSEVRALADRCAAHVAREYDDASEAPTADDLTADARRSVDRLTGRRIMGYVRSMGEDQSPAAAHRLARFLAWELRLSTAWVLNVLRAWSGDNAHPLTESELSAIVSRVQRVRRVS